MTLKKQLLERSMFLVLLATDDKGGGKNWWLKEPMRKVSYVPKRGGGYTPLESQGKAKRLQGKKKKKNKAMSKNKRERQKGDFG